MKKNSRMQRLVLARETIRKLSEDDLARIQGALKPFPTKPIDPTLADACTWGGGSLCDLTTM